MTQVTHLLESLLNRLLQSLLVIMTLSVCWQVVSRYFLASPSSFTEELARFCLIWLSLLGAVYAYRHHAHIGLDMLYQKAGPVLQKYFYLAIHSSIALFALLVLIIGGSSLVLMTNELGQISPVLNWQFSYVYSVIPLSGVLLLSFALQNLTTGAQDA